ncbi:uncharacterized protein LOC133928993 isoform X2 [Phragmites australis]|uniref:uncharacterized protein LOC133928993 isoform X2 n=1 Tax=Phragmites australis TaxID=29695 RepID=UPI002D79C691|nr:uncharacterized protein LOC133928993 isoform X2 [Phragmites australis]
MATEWSDGGEEFLLPEEFLDDDFFSEEEKAAVAARSESDEDCLDGLSRRLAGLLGEGGERKPPAKAELTVGSPQSTLCGLPKSGQESPDSGASKGNSPPSSPLEQQPADPWELLYEVAGQVARMRAMANSIPVLRNPHAFVAPARKPSPPPVAAPATKVPAGGYYHPFAHLVAQRQMQFHLKQQHLLKLQRERQLAAAAAWNSRQGFGAEPGGCGAVAPLGLNPAAWPPLQKPQQRHAPSPSAACMRAVFLTLPGAKSERTGTGVFLPRAAGAPAEPKNKPGCSTVLVPARVVHALNLNLDDLGAQPRHPGGFVLDQDALISRSNAMMASQKRTSSAAVPAPALCYSS